MGLGGGKMKKPATITNDEAKKIMGMLTGYDRDIFWIGVETGLRISDILKLRVGDVQRNPLEIYETKSKRMRIIPISDELYTHLREKYRYYFSFPFGNVSKPIFLTHRGTGRHINRSTYHRHLKRVLGALKTKTRVSAHSTRKLYAQNIFAKTGNIFAVQNAMNHRYVTTTAAYLDIDVTELIKLAAETVSSPELGPPHQK